MLFLSTCWKVTDFKTPIVLDTGSGLMKAGFADEDLPNVVFPTIIGMPKYEVDGSMCPFTQGTEIIPVLLLDQPCFFIHFVFPGNYERWSRERDLHWS